MLTPRHAARLSALVTSCAVAFSAIAQSTAPPGQTYPAKPIRIITTEAGSGNDIAVRIMAPGLTAALGQQMIVDNRGIGSAELAAKAPPDGYTLLSYGTSLWLTPLLRNNVTYDPIRDYAPITLTARAPGIIVVPVSLPAKSIPELIALARSKPGELNYGSAATGSLPHLAGELFKSMAGVDMVHVPYKGGGPMVTDALGGQIQVVLGDQANLMPHVQTGKLRALAVATTKRSANAPAIATIAESGLPGFDATAWQGLVGPVGMNPDVIKKINEAFNKVMTTPAVHDKLVAGGLEPMGGTPQQFGRFIDAEITKWTKIAKDVGVKAE